MKFRTEITPESFPFPINLDKGALFLGSCFADYVGASLRDTLWNVCQNPCGTLFNPTSVANVVKIALSSPEQMHDSIEKSLFHKNNSWGSFMLSTEFSDSDRNTCFANALSAFRTLGDYLKSAGTIFITFGTANIYALAAHSDYVVSNCHKLPAATFINRMMTVDEITSLWIQTANAIRAVNPDCAIIFTVSPVRHIRDGYHRNTISKSTLLIATSCLCEDIDRCGYFPAYELITDDLRDYRFYAQDLVHPSAQAIEYVREKLFESAFSPEQQKILNTGLSLRKRLEHRPVNPDSKESEFFRLKTEELCSEFLLTHPGFRR